MEAVSRAHVREDCAAKNTNSVDFVALGFEHLNIKSTRAQRAPYLGEMGRNCSARTNWSKWPASNLDDAHKNSKI